MPTVPRPPRKSSVVHYAMRMERSLLDMSPGHLSSFVPVKGHGGRKCSQGRRSGSPELVPSPRCLVSLSLVHRKGEGLNNGPSWVDHYGVKVPGGLYPCPPGPRPGSPGPTAPARSHLSNRPPDLRPGLLLQPSNPSSNTARLRPPQTVLGAQASPPTLPHSSPV